MAKLTHCTLQLPDLLMLFVDFPKPGVDIFNNIDLPIFVHNQSMVYSYSPRVDFFNQSPNIHPNDKFSAFWQCD